MLMKPTTIKMAPTSQAIRNGKEMAFIVLVPETRDFFALSWYCFVT
jgi:hypothetical protein